MALTKLERLIHDGEGLTVEFKRCENGLVNDVYETVSAFSNRYGGHIILGVEDNGRVCGVNLGAVTGIKKNFVNTLNNPQRFAPTQFLALEEAEIDGKTVLWCYVPPSSQVVMFGGRIYARAEDGDMDITRNSEMVAQIHRRKSADYSERKVYPFAKDEDFDFARLVPKVRRLATNRQTSHPWANMSDMEILQSAGLFQEDRETGKSGYNLAAILLFGRDEVIRSCTANYVTDAICRRENVDRYDDRLMVTTNLIDAYEQLIEFIAKHTLDRFFLIGDQSVSVRSKIARELVSNILVHREYTSAYPAKIIIERGRIVTENWSLPKNPGRIDPQNFTPYPKNPLLAAFFTNIGRADVLGSGVRNLYRFTKIYSGGTPELIDGDIFKTIVPLDLLNEAALTDDEAEKVTDWVTDSADRVTDNAGKVTDWVTDSADRVTDNAEKVTDGVTDSADRVTDNAEKVTDGVTDSADRVTDDAEKVTDWVTDSADRVTDNAGKVTNRVTDSADRVTDDAEKVIDGVTDSVDRVTDNQKRMIEEFFKNQHITTKEMSEIIGISTRKIKENIAKLKEKGILERIGPEKRGYWRIINSEIAETE